MILNAKNKESGYALLVTLMIILVFSVLGVSLMMMTMNGSAKNEIRQDITRSTDLSIKGIDLITTKINYDLTEYLGANGKPRADFIYQLERTLDLYLCSGTNTISLSGETGTSDVCIDTYEDTLDDKGQANPLRKLVTFTSLGESGKSTENVVSKIEIGAESAPEALKYAIGTNIDLKDGTQDGEGNLLIHGGADIQGDIKVDGNIVTSSNGYALLGADRWIPSLLPSAIPLPGTDSAKLVLGKNAFTFNTAPSYASHIVNSNFSSNTYTNRNNIEDLFRTGYAPVIVQRDPNKSPIQISAQKANFEYKYNSSNVDVITADSNMKIKDNYSPNLKVYFSYEDKGNIYCAESDYVWEKRYGKWEQVWYCTRYVQPISIKYDGTYTLEGNNSFRQAATQGNVRFLNTDTKFQNGLYVEGNLSIGNNSTSYNVNNYSKVTLDGPIYVNGNLSIKGADLHSNALIYVNGEVTIEHSRINGKSLTGNKKGSLIVFSKGNIKISNNSVNYDDPSYIKGFFYSEKDFEMYGVGSNMKIEGGISARKIVLNAIRGRARDADFNGAYKIPYRNDYFEGQSGQASRNSRLQVIYDTEIISTYSDLKQQEPIIYKVDPPIITDRKN